MCGNVTELPLHARQIRSETRGRAVVINNAAAYLHVWPSSLDLEIELLDYRCPEKKEKKAEDSAQRRQRNQAWFSPIGCELLSRCRRITTDLISI